MVLSQKFSPTKRNGDDAVVIRHAHEEFFTQPKLRGKLKELVTEAESLADELMGDRFNAEGQAAVQADEINRRLEGIDWDADEDSET
jgi:hypothetical protein